MKVYVDALIFEPGNLEGRKKTYLHGQPINIARYLADYAPSKSSIVAGPKILICPGPGNGCPHQYLYSETSIVCLCYKREFCHTCLHDSNKVLNIVKINCDSEKLFFERLK